MPAGNQLRTPRCEARSLLLAQALLQTAMPPVMVMVVVTVPVVWLTQPNARRRLSAALGAATHAYDRPPGPVVRQQHLGLACL